MGNTIGRLFVRRRGIGKDQTEGKQTVDSSDVVEIDLKAEKFEQEMKIVRKLMEECSFKERFKIGKVHHHQTLMMEVLHYASKNEAFPMLYMMSKGSRGYLIKYWSKLKVYLSYQAYIPQKDDAYLRELFEMP